LPDRVRLVLRRRPDLLPLRLRRLDVVGRALPIGRVGERLDAHAQRLLLLEIGRALLVELREVRLAPLEELVARAAEALPDRVRLLLRHLPDALPLFLQRLDRLGRLL